MGKGFCACPSGAPCATIPVSITCPSQEEPDPQCWGLPCVQLAQPGPCSLPAFLGLNLTWRPDGNVAAVPGSQLSSPWDKISCGAGGFCPLSLFIPLSLCSCRSSQTKSLQEHTNKQNCSCHFVVTKRLILFWEQRDHSGVKIKLVNETLVREE